MKLSKRDFLKWIGGGSLAAGAHALAGSPIDPPSAPGVQELVPVPVSIDATERNLQFSYYQCIEAEFFDRIKFRAGSFIPESIEFFRVPQYQICPYTNVVKDAGLSNIYSSSHHGFNPPLSFFAREFLISIGFSREFDVRRLSDYAWNFKLLDKYIVQGSVAIHSRIGENERAVSFAFPAPSGLYIPPMAKFEARMQGVRGFESVLEKEGGKGLDITFSMRGLQWAGVQ